MYYIEHKPKTKNRGGLGSVDEDDSVKEKEGEGEEKCLYLHGLLEGRLAAPTVLKYHQAKDCYIIMLCDSNLEGTLLTV